MKKRGNSSVVIVSSTAGSVPQPGATIYSTSMAMLNMLVQCAALETAYHGVRINAVAPGVTYTKARKKQEAMGKDFDNERFMHEQSQFVPL
jgi:NAD(P)-dependent dehydrogenase (short-subunit alcohol dehydrogenase family)